MAGAWLEKELEDWMWHDNPESGEAMLWPALRSAGVSFAPGSTACRQLRIPIGICDFVICGGGTVTVVELKAVTADGNALTQVLSYCAWFAHAEPAARVYGVIVAPSFSERLIQAQDALSNIALVPVRTEYAFGTETWRPTEADGAVRPEVQSILSQLWPKPAAVEAETDAQE